MKTQLILSSTGLTKMLALQSIIGVVPMQTLVLELFKQEKMNRFLELLNEEIDYSDVLMRSLNFVLTDNPLFFASLCKLLEQSELNNLN